jgi:hypothetical protein
MVRVITDRNATRMDKQDIFKLSYLSSAAQLESRLFICNDNFRVIGKGASIDVI